MENPRAVSNRTKELEKLSGIQYFIRELRYHEFSRHNILSVKPIANAPPDAPSPITIEINGTLIKV